MNDNQNISTPQYINQTTNPNQPTKAEDSGSRKSIITTICCVVIAIILTATITAIITNHINNAEENEDEDDEDYSMTIERNDTPFLQLYSTLGEEMTISELKEKLQGQYANAKLTINDDNTGTVTMDGVRDYISFYYDSITEKENEAEENEEEDEIYDPSAVTNYEVTEVTNYDPSTTIQEIMYIYEPESIEDAPLSIGYSEEDNVYYVDVFYETFEFPTKQEAIDAYLSK